jgi:hypothetical protein
MWHGGGESKKLDYRKAPTKVRLRPSPRIIPEGHGNRSFTIRFGIPWETVLIERHAATYY